MIKCDGEKENTKNNLSAPKLFDTLGGRGMIRNRGRGKRDGGKISNIKTKHITDNNTQT